MVFIKDHLEGCLKFPIDCILCCGKEAIPRDMMEEHVTTECPKAEVICPFTLHGCNFKVSICFVPLYFNWCLKWLKTIQRDYLTLLRMLICLIYGALASGWCVMSVGEISGELWRMKKKYWPNIYQKTEKKYQLQQSAVRHDLEARLKSLSCVQTDPLHPVKINTLGQRPGRKWG